MNIVSYFIVFVVITGLSDLRTYPKSCLQLSKTGSDFMYARN